MLACARIGAAHSVVFGGFSAQALRERIQDGGCTAVITADGGWRRGAVLAAQAAGRRGAAQGLDDVHTVLVVRARDRTRSSGARAATCWYHELVGEASAECAPEPMDSEDLLFLLYTSGSTGKPKGILHTTGGYLVGAYLHDAVRLRPARGRRLLVHGRRRLGHGPQLHRLRPARERRDGRDVRGRAEHAAPRALLGDRRAPRGHGLLHGADGDPRVHALGRRARRAKHDLSSPAPARHGRRADQPRGVDVVPRDDRRRALPDRRHVVADGDGRDHDHAAAGRHRHASRARRRARSSASTPAVVDETGDELGTEPGRLPGDQAALALDAARHLGRRERYRETYWIEVPGRATSPATARGATRTATSGSSGASTTCSTSPATACRRWRSRARSSATTRWPRPPSSAGPTSSRARRSAPSSRRAAASRRARSSQRRAPEHVAQGDRQARAARRDPLRRGAAQDAQRQDHAPPPARHRRRPRDRAATRARSRTSASSRKLRNFEE